MSEVTQSGLIPKGQLKVPASVRIGGHVIRIIPVKDLVTDQDAFGIWDDGKLEIQIDAGLSTSLAWETLWHECIEAIVSMTEMNLEHHKIQTLGLLVHQAFASMVESLRRGK